jgi:hypothetical protein
LKVLWEKRGARWRSTWRIVSLIRWEKTILIQETHIKPGPLDSTW